MRLGPVKVSFLLALDAAHTGFQHPLSITMLPKEPCVCGTASAACPGTVTVRDLEMYCWPDGDLLISMEIRGADQLEAAKLHVHSIVSVNICVDFSLNSYGSGLHDPARILLDVGHGDLTP